MSILIAFAAVGVGAWAVTWMRPGDAARTVAAALLVAGLAVALASRLRRR